MPQAIVPAHQPSWYWVPVRVVIITFLLTLLTFALCLLLGILGLVISAALRGVHPNLTSAYRDFAFPVAMTVAAVVLVSATIMEVRRYRRMKTLAGIARASS
jgi:phosphoglycerol transferase MdoB-like AlkP superfamily enzyme